MDAFTAINQLCTTAIAILAIDEKQRESTGQHLLGMKEFDNTYKALETLLDITPEGVSEIVAATVEQMKEIKPITMHHITHATDR